MKKMYLFSALAILGVAIFLFLSYISPIKNSSLQLDDTRQGSAELFFQNDNVLVSTTSSQVVTSIFLKSNIPVETAQIELSFNPEFISNVEIVPAQNNFFGGKDAYSILLSEVREEIGRVSFAVGGNGGAIGEAGEKPVATLSFQAIAFPPLTTQITFVNKSSILPPNSRTSILQRASPLTITFQ